MGNGWAGDFRPAALVFGDQIMRPFFRQIYYSWLGESLALDSMTELSLASSGQYFTILGEAYPKKIPDYLTIVLLSCFEKVSTGILQKRGDFEGHQGCCGTGWGLPKCILVPQMPCPRPVKLGPDWLGLILFFYQLQSSLPYFTSHL